MNATKAKIRLVSLVLTLSVSISVGYLVLRREQIKKHEAVLKANDFQSGVRNTLYSYKQEYMDAVNKQKEVNKNEMLLAKDNYEKLLQEQPTLVSQHTRQIASTEITTSTQTNSSTKNSSTSNSSISLSKPKITRETKAS